MKKRSFLDDSTFWMVGLTILMALSAAGVAVGIEAFRVSLLFSSVALASLVMGRVLWRRSGRR